MSIEAFSHYEDRIAKTAIYPGPNTFQGLQYCTLGLCGEAGEVADKVKKIARDHDGFLNGSARVALLKECSDVLWYLAGVTRELDSSLGEIAQMNADKVTDRMTRGVITGNGDDR
jgi:NTP pyrophosphatase (non-canonical NTP hydrolase)